ncbi:MAG: LD-carboxypeptidase [Clostridium sp.]|nr:LD-carboxypeptidase [Clostridium sp.]
MLKGKALKPNSTLGIIAPASCEDKSIITEKLNVFANLGFNLKLGEHLYDKYGYLAGTDYYRAYDINSMFLDNSIDGIVCFRGGYGSIRALPYIDKTIIKHNPKFFCGYSDITLLLNYFSKLGLITFHGPMVNSNLQDELTLNYFKEISSYKEKGYTYDLNKFNNIKYINPGNFKGKISGGNLTMICSALGTPYEVQTQNSILLLEDINENPYVIDRMLTLLLLNKKIFKSCKGIILGSFEGCSLSNYSKSFKLEEIIMNRLKPLNVPIITGFPFGHSYPNITIPIGVNATFNYNKKLLTISNSFLL